MNVFLFLFGLGIGIAIGAKMYSAELKSVERRKSELAALYYQQLDALTEKLAQVEEELRLSKL